MDIHDLTVFATAARLGSVTRAARSLSTVQSNVTTRIRLLETELKVQLFHRNHRGITLTEVRSVVSGDIDLNGIFGLNPEVRNGYQNISVRFTLKGDAPAEKLRALVEQSRARSAVYDILTGHVPVGIEVEAA